MHKKIKARAQEHGSSSYAVYSCCSRRAFFTLPARVFHFIRTTIPGTLCITIYRRRAFSQIDPPGTGLLWPGLPGLGLLDSDFSHFILFNWIILESVIRSLSSRNSPFRFSWNFSIQTPSVFFICRRKRHYLRMTKICDMQTITWIEQIKYYFDNESINIFSIASISLWKHIINSKID